MRFVVALFILLLVCAEMHADDWLQFNGNSGNRTSNETIGTIDWTESSPPTIDWEISTPQGYSAFTVMDGKAFTLITRSGRECCIALNAATGAEIWAQPLSVGSGYDGYNGPRSTPVTDGEQVYVYDSQMILYCFNDETGASIWNQDIENDYGGRNILYTCAQSPLLEGEKVIVYGGGPTQFILAFNRTNGNLNWQTDVSAYTTDWMTHSTPVAADIHGVRQVVFIAASTSGPTAGDANLISVSPDTGNILWRSGAVDYHWLYAGSPVIHDNYIYLSDAYACGATVFRVDFDGSTFSTTQIWHNSDHMTYWSPPVYYNGHLYGLFGYRDYISELRCVDFLTGDSVWPSNPSFGRPAGLILVEDKLVMLTNDDEIYVVEATPTAYTEVTHASVLSGGQGWSHPILSDNYIYVRTTTNGVRFPLSSMSPTEVTLTYTAGPGGSIEGISPQTIEAGGDGSPVTAVADEGYIFRRWSDSSTLNPRIDTNVTKDVSVTGIFRLDVEAAAGTWILY